MFGPEYTIGASALLLVALSQFLAMAFGPADTIMQMTGMERVLRNDIFVFLAMNFVLNLLLIPPFGMTGAAIATGITSIAANAIMAWQVLRYRRVHTVLAQASGKG